MGYCPRCVNPAPQTAESHPCQIVAIANSDQTLHGHTPMDQLPADAAPIEPAHNADRRAHARMAVARPAKVLLPRAQRYVPGRTLNVSVNGALVEVQTTRAPAEGESIGLAIAWSDAVVLPTSSVVEAKVIRRTIDGDKVTLALCYSAAQTLAKPAGRAAIKAAA